MSEILKQSRRLRFDPAAVRESVLNLRDASLITFSGDLADDTVIRLT